VKHLLFIILLIAQSPAQGQDSYKKDREEMVRTQIERRGIRDPMTLSALRKVKRHLFVPDYLKDRAYEDRPLPIGYGQTISQPYIVAFMTDIIQPNSEFKVLEIGSGSGYQAAVLAEIVAEVYTIEIVPELGEKVFKRFKKLGYENVKSMIRDGYHGWPEKGPFDAIIVTAAAEFIPPPLIKQLKDGGKMIIPVGSPFMVQKLMLIEKKGDKTTTKNMMLVRFVPFTRGE